MVNRTQSLLPPSLQDDRFLTLEALLQRLRAIDLNILRVYNPQTVEATALPHLAEQFDVMGVKGWSLADTDAKRRNLIARAIELHQKAGTPYAIKLALQTIGYPNVTIAENPGLYYNGRWSYNGDELYGGRRLGGFIVTLDPVLSVVSRDRIRLIIDLINAWKNQRSQLLDLRMGSISLFENLLVYDGDWTYDGAQVYDGILTNPNA